MDGRVSSPVFIGRADELERLSRALDQARHGRNATFVVAGGAGIGKTRLMAEFINEARRAGATVLSGACIDLGGDRIPFGPFVEGIRTWIHATPEAEVDEALGPGRSVLARLVPTLGPVPDEGMAGPASGLWIASEQGRLYEHVLAMLERLSAAGPVVVVVEDLHWSDRSTRDLLAFLIRNVRGLGVVVVMTYRSDDVPRRHPLHHFLAELERSGIVDRLDLGPLDRRQVIAQLHAIAGRGLERALADKIWARSEGNPFYVEELLARASDSDAATLPPTLREVLLARISDLPEPSQLLLRVAAAAGRHVDPTLLGATTGMDPAALYDALREAVAHQVLVPEVIAGEERYAFRHALVQEAIYDDLLPGERSRLHAEFADTLERSAPGDVSRSSELAYHRYAAHDVPRAFDAALIAADAAESGYAYPEALAHRERALELWDRLPDAESRAGADRVELLASAASAAAYHEPERALAHIRTALSIVVEGSDPIRAGLLHERLGRYAWLAGQGEEALDAYRDAVGLIPAEPPSEARARALAGLAQILMLHRRYQESRLTADEAVTLARSIGARQVEGHALNTRGEDRVHDGEVAAALDDMMAALRIAEELASVDDIGRAYANRVDVLWAAGRFDDALAAVDQGLEVVRRLGIQTWFRVHGRCQAANILYRLGRWDESEAVAMEAETIGATPGINEIMAREVLARLAVARGRFDAARDELEALRPLAVRSADGQVTMPVHAALAELALWQHRPADAAAIIATGIELCGHSTDVRYGELFALGLRAEADLAERARAKRSTDGASSAVAAGLAIHDASRERHSIFERRSALRPQSWAWMALCDAEAQRLEGIAAPTAWARSGRAFDELGFPYPAAYARWREAEALLAARGDRKRVASTLINVLETAAALGAEPLTREALSLAVRARISLGLAWAADSPAGRATGLGLTARESEVLVLVAAGRSNRQIGEELFITEKTAGLHVSNILGKLGVAGRGEAAAMAHRLGLAQPVDALVATEPPGP